MEKIRIIRYPTPKRDGLAIIDGKIILIPSKIDLFLKNGVKTNGQKRSAKRE
jgi:hypothetical protein